MILAAMLGHFGDSLQYQWTRLRIVWLSRQISILRALKRRREG